METVKFFRFSYILNYLFLSKSISNFPIPSPSEIYALPLDFVLGRDPKNIFYYQRDVENYTEQNSNFSLIDKHEYTHGISLSVVLVCIFMLRVYVTFSLFFKIWLAESILIFGEQLFSCWSSLASYCLLTFYVTILFPMKKSSLHCNDAAYTCKEKLWRKFAGECQMS